MRVEEFYIETIPNVAGEDPEYYQLSCTLDFRVVHSGKATIHTTVDRKTITDSYLNENTRVTFNGVITNILNLSLVKAQKPLSDNINALVALKESGNPFILHYDSSLPALSNCVFESLEFSKSSGYGGMYDVAGSVIKMLQSSQVGISDEQFKQDTVVNKQASPKYPKGNKATTKVDVSDKEKREAVLNKIRSSVRSGGAYAYY